MAEVSTSKLAELARLLSASDPRIKAGYLLRDLLQEASENETPKDQETP